MYKKNISVNNTFTGGDKMSVVGNQAIKCRVETCKYHESSDYCNLKDIVIGAEKTDATENCDTECKSFECGCN